MLDIINLHVEVEGQEILKGISLKIQSGKIHALMGPNGSGKSTLANALMGHPKYKITKGQIILDNVDITNEKTDKRAKAGLFLSFQHPQEISGVRITNFLRTAVNEVKNTNHSVIDFHKLLKEKMTFLNMDSSFLKRNLNEGFSGGEKKRAEMLQMLMLNPKYAMLDETDSGLDVDAIRIVAEGINKVKDQMGILLITHYDRFLNHLKPDTVSIINDGKIIKQGNYELAEQIQNEGFTGIINGN
ncbi:Fe-S cluster assembly ATPase SufC [Candidatus Woesearchaeota archaeon]|nr:Fe-S cluster assembly ATPase SufC [Candidatus Woesearchaeota archaeon]